MSVIELISRYKPDLNVPNGTGMQGIVNIYRDFAQRLVGLYPFNYTKDYMLMTSEHMKSSLNLSRHSRCYTTLYLMRRAALESLPNVSARIEIWDLLELADFISDEDGIKRLEEAINYYMARAGKPEVEKNLLKVKEDFKKVEKEIDRLYESVREDGIISIEAAENHSRHFTLEIVQFNEILKIASSL